MKNINMYVITLVAIVAVIGVGLTTTWFLRPTGKATASASGEAKADVEEDVTISLPTDTVDFGTVSLKESYDTTDDEPSPFVVQNDGSVPVNVSLNATELWTDSDSAVSSDFQVMCDEDDTSCGNGSAESWTDVPGGTVETTETEPVQVIADLPNSNKEDSNEMEVNITVPESEEKGNKDSSITFISEAAS